MTNTWQDIKNADVIVEMGGNSAEAHPCGFKWVVEAKLHNRAKVVVVDDVCTTGASTVEAIEAAREMGRQAALDAVRDVELMPGPSAGVGEVQEFARLASGSFGHAVGTCKIGVDEMAVVDPQLRVRGVEGLRVADSSVMPRIPTGPTNAPTFMVAGKAAQLILG